MLILILTPVFISLLWVLLHWLTNKAYTPFTKWPRVASPSARNCALHATRGRKMWSEISLWANVCLDVFCARPGREDDSKCHFVVWGQPSQTHSSCRRCCHPPPHCLCKWCLQSPSDTWRFHPPSVTLLLCLLLRSYKLSHRPSARALSHLLHRSPLKRFDLKGLKAGDRNSDVRCKEWD